jgi:cyclophilin family peptidyl-prolyl cis-trans isomerase
MVATESCKAGSKPRILKDAQDTIFRRVSRGDVHGVSNLPFVQGTSIAATVLPGEPNSAGSQFLIIVLISLSSPDNSRHSVTSSSIEVVDKISTTPVDDKQIARDRIEIKDIPIRARPRPRLAVHAETVEELFAIASCWRRRENIKIEMLPDKAPNHVRHFYD